MADDIREMSEVATVQEQRGDEVLVSIKMNGFPENFKLQAGDQVALVHSEYGMIAKPLVDSEVVDMNLGPEPSFAGGAEQSIALSENTACPDDLLGAEAGGQRTVRVWTIQSTDDGRRRAVAVRAESD